MARSLLRGRTVKITDYLREDHRRLHGWLDDPASFELFRGGLLRHIGIEEKVLFAEIKRLLGAPLPEVRALRIEHAALTSLMVPTPDAALIAEVRGLLGAHDAKEEGGVYEACEAILGDELSRALCDRARSFAGVPLAPHFDGHGTHRTADSALASARRLRQARP